MVEIIMNQIKPYKINGTINAVASKSYLQRALAIACLAQGESVIKNFYPSDDALVAKNPSKFWHRNKWCKEFKNCP